MEYTYTPIHDQSTTRDGRRAFRTAGVLAAAALALVACKPANGNSGGQQNASEVVCSVTVRSEAPFNSVIGIADQLDTAYASAIKNSDGSEVTQPFNPEYDLQPGMTVEYAGVDAGKCAAIGGLAVG